MGVFWRVLGSLGRHAESSILFRTRVRTRTERACQYCKLVPVLGQDALPSIDDRTLQTLQTRATLGQGKLVQDSAENQSISAQEKIAWRPLAIASIGESPRSQLAANESKSIATHSLPESLEVRGNLRLVADIFNSCASVAIQLFRAFTIVYIFFTIPLPFSCDFQPS